ncbi:MAG: hypothetical protein KDD13_03400 [Mangrovimonas sp.]|nr:hypothetical protein [Mangrovimonas sp.]MCB0427999.1 hypothetical protein [Mangrovimonas sp.]HPF97309.1 hypothetical protein [Mangrovimonas sp.]
MKLVQRLGYYLAGMSVGLIFLAFFLKGKNFSCDYGPQARVKKALTTKAIHYNGQDSTLVKTILTTGRVNFSKSEAQKKPCGDYYVEALVNSETMAVLVSNCDSLVTVLKLEKVLEP